jgi:hypothetical protein
MVGVLRVPLIHSPDNLSADQRSSNTILPVPYGRIEHRRHPLYHQLLRLCAARQDGEPIPIVHPCTACQLPHWF